jgi:hypothetical protein
MWCDNKSQSLVNSDCLYSCTASSREKTSLSLMVDNINMAVVVVSCYIYNINKAFVHYENDEFLV